MLVMACAKTAADQAPQEPRSTAEVDAAAAPAEDAEPAVVPIAITGVYIEPTVASACGLVMSPKAYFAFDSTDLTAGDTAVLRQVGQCLATGPLAGRRVTLVGHTDPRGSDAYNQELGRSRAESVQEFLVTEGVNAANLEVRSVGEANTDPEDPAEWPRDRRVDITLTPTPAQ